MEITGCRREDLCSVVNFSDWDTKLVCRRCGRCHDGYGNPRPDWTPEELEQRLQESRAWWASFDIDMDTLPQAKYESRCVGLFGQ